MVPKFESQIKCIKSFGDMSWDYKNNTALKTHFTFTPLHTHPKLVLDYSWKIIFLFHFILKVFSFFFLLEGYMSLPDKLPLKPLLALHERISRSWGYYARSNTQNRHIVQVQRKRTLWAEWNSSGKCEIRVWNWWGCFHIFRSFKEGEIHPKIMSLLLDYPTS